MSANIPLSQSQDGTRVQKLNQLSLSWPSESNLPSPLTFPFLPSHPLTFPFWPVLPTLAYLLRC